MNRQTIIFLILLGLFVANTPCNAAEDLFADYKKSLQKPAEAHAVEIYNAWSENLTNMIESGYTDGVVIEGEGKYKNGKVEANKFGVVEVDKYANVGPIINKSTFKNSTIIVKNGSKF